jgi:hypothetical protein
MNLADVMDEIAARLDTIDGLNVFAYPVATFDTPTAVVTYPSSYTFDATYGRGVDRIQGSVVVFVGNPTEPQSRDLLSVYVDGSGAKSIKQTLDDEYTTFTVRVSTVDFDVYSVSGVDYLTAIFDLDIAGSGTA